MLVVFKQTSSTGQRLLAPLSFQHARPSGWTRREDRWHIAGLILVTFFEFAGDDLDRLGSNEADGTATEARTRHSASDHALLFRNRDFTELKRKEDWKMKMLLQIFLH